MPDYYPFTRDHRGNRLFKPFLVKCVDCQLPTHPLNALLLENFEGDGYPMDKPRYMCPRCCESHGVEAPNAAL